MVTGCIKTAVLWWVVVSNVCNLFCFQCVQWKKHIWVMGIQHWYWKQVPSMHAQIPLQTLFCREICLTQEVVQTSSVAIVRELILLLTIRQLSLHMKDRLYIMSMRRAMFYDGEISSFLIDDVKSLNDTKNSMVRWMCSASPMRLPNK